MANLGLLGAIAGFGKGMSDFGAELVKRREQALAWAEKNAEYERQRADKQSDTQALYAHEDDLLGKREAAADARTQKEIDARAAENDANRKFKVDDREDDQAFQADQKAKDRAAALERERAIEKLRHSDDEDEIRLRQDIEKNDVAGIKYGERWSINPRTNRPYKDPNSQYAEVLTVRKDGSVIHTGKLMLAPQNRSGQDDDPSSSPY